MKSGATSANKYLIEIDRSKIPGFAYLKHRQRGENPVTEYKIMVSIPSAAITIR